VTATGLLGEQTEDNTMVTEGHRHAGRKSKEENLAEMDKELAEIRADIEKLELRMQQKAKSRWVYEWPMKKPKVKWPVKELMVRRQRRLLKGWLRYAENLDGPEEMVQVCEPETGRGLNDEENELGSVEDLKNCQEGREEIPDCQVGKEMRSLWDLTDCQEDSQGISHCQLGNDMRSLWDLGDCQEGNESISNCQVGRDEHSRLSESLMDSEVSSIQQGVLMKMGSVDLIIFQESSEQIPYFQVGRDKQMDCLESHKLRGELESARELTEQMSSEMSLDQHVQLTKEEEDQDNLLMIGGIEIFLPLA
jgi:hypothetical protein